jgi:hypothetical protein
MRYNALTHQLVEMKNIFYRVSECQNLARASYQFPNVGQENVLFAIRTDLSTFVGR